jgi:hypothetical protein
MLRIRERTPTPCIFDVFTFRLTIECIKEFGGALEMHRPQVQFNVLVMRFMSNLYIRKILLLHYARVFI